MFAEVGSCSVDGDDDFRWTLAISKKVVEIMRLNVGYQLEYWRDCWNKGHRHAKLRVGAAAKNYYNGH